MTDEIVEEPVVVDVPETSSVDVHEIALLALSGRMGRGRVRRARIVSRGADPDDVALEIARILNQ